MFDIWNSFLKLCPEIYGEKIYFSFFLSTLKWFENAKKPEEKQPKSFPLFLLLFAAFSGVFKNFSIFFILGPSKWHKWLLTQILFCRPWPGAICFYFSIKRGCSVFWRFLGIFHKFYHHFCSWEWFPPSIFWIHIYRKKRKKNQNVHFLK